VPTSQPVAGVAAALPLCGRDGQGAGGKVVEGEATCAGCLTRCGLAAPLPGGAVPRGCEAGLDSCLCPPLGHMLSAQGCSWPSGSVREDAPEGRFNRGACSAAEEGAEVGNSRCFAQRLVTPGASSSGCSAGCVGCGSPAVASLAKRCLVCWSDLMSFAICNRAAHSV